MVLEAAMAAVADTPAAWVAPAAGWAGAAVMAEEVSVAGRAAMAAMAGKADLGVAKVAAEKAAETMEESGVAPGAMEAGLAAEGKAAEGWGIK